MKKVIPILFNTLMVQAILEGRKIQTRRPVKASDLLDLLNHNPEVGYIDAQNNYQICKPGDILWVRESAKVVGIKGTTGFHYAGQPPVGYKSIKEIGVEYVADGSRCALAYPERLSKNIELGRKLSNGCFYEACRLWLEVTAVRVERLQDISESDAQKEGVLLHERGKHWLNYVDQKHNLTQFIYNRSTAKESFATLWESINSKTSWLTNPWVWVISFKVISKTGKPSDI